MLHLLTVKTICIFSNINRHRHKEQQLTIHHQAHQEEKFNKIIYSSNL